MVWQGQVPSLIVRKVQYGDTTKEGENYRGVAISEQELRTEVDTPKEEANSQAVAIKEQELCTEIDTTKEGANN